MREFTETRAFFNEYYAPANAWMAVVGDIDPAQTRRDIERYFAWIPNLSAPKPVDTTEPPQTQARRFESVDAHANLPAVALAWTGMPRRRSEPDFYALGLLGRLLFNGKSARLYQALIKQAQTAISVDGGLGFPVSDLDEYKQPGLFGAFVVHKATAAPEAVRQSIVDEIQKVAAEGVSAEELERVKTKLRSDHIVAGQTTLGRASRLLVAALLDGGPEAADEELARFLRVTPEQVEQAARRYLVEARSNTFIVRTKQRKEAP